MAMNSLSGITVTFAFLFNEHACSCICFQGYLRKFTLEMSKRGLQSSFRHDGYSRSGINLHSEILTFYTGHHFVKWINDGTAMVDIKLGVLVLVVYYALTIATHFLSFRTHAVMSNCLFVPTHPRRMCLSALFTPPLGLV